MYILYYTIISYTILSSSVLLPHSLLPFSSSDLFFRSFPLIFLLFPPIPIYLLPLFHLLSLLSSCSILLYLSSDPSPSFILYVSALTYAHLYSNPLTSLLSSSPFPPLLSHLLFLLLSSHIHSIRVGINIRSFIFHSASDNSDPAQTNGGECRVVQF